MTTHELARVLLDAPDAPARIYVYDGNDWLFHPVEYAFVPSTDDVEHMGLTSSHVGYVMVQAGEGEVTA
jgi:hypothetical protein